MQLAIYFVIIVSSLRHPGRSTASAVVKLKMQKRRERDLVGIGDQFPKPLDRDAPHLFIGRFQTRHGMTLHVFATRSPEKDADVLWHSQSECPAIFDRVVSLAL